MRGTLRIRACMRRRRMLLAHTMGCLHWVVPLRVSIGIQVLEKRNINRENLRDCDNVRSKLEGVP